MPRETSGIFDDLRRQIQDLRHCRCGKPNDRYPQRYCRDCHATYMRTWRKTHPLTPSQRRKDNARSYANVYLSRGKITRQPCEVCGEEKAQMHHDDYARPIAVRWLCRPCHLELHAIA